VAASAGCNSYDVVAHTSYGGFLSEPFYLFINRPWNTVAANDPNGPFWVSHSPLYNGYYTRYNHETKSMCALDPSMNYYDINELFTGHIVDYPGSNWGACAAGSKWIQFTRWEDNIFNATPNSSPGDPATGWPPQWTNPGASHTPVDRCLQSWYVGSLTPGSRARIQSNTLRRYTDSGEHEDIATPNP